MSVSMSATKKMLHQIGCSCGKINFVEDADMVSRSSLTFSKVLIDKSLKYPRLPAVKM